MTAGAEPFAAIVNALGLPPSARVDARVPKKLLIERGAPSAADKRAMQEGLDELQWFAACKPATIGVPAFSDAGREYLEVAIIGSGFRQGAKTARLVELIHRAIPYPVLLVSSDETTITLSAAHKRHSQSEVGATVVERIVSASISDPGSDPAQAAFLNSLLLAKQPRSDLYELYSGWLSRIEALNAARVTGVFATTDNQTAIDRRREALDAHASLAKEIERLRAKAKREKQLNRRVNLNLQIQQREAEMAAVAEQL